MNNIFGVTRKNLESYFESIGEKNLKPLKFLNGYIFIRFGI